jgi:AcrR family transcriptional regulator
MTSAPDPESDGGAVSLGQRATARREGLIALAAELFEAKGYHLTSMDDIAQAAGIRKPTLYHYFKSKSEILTSIHEEFIEILIGRQFQRAELNLSPEQALFEAMADNLELMETHRGYVRVFFEHHRDLPQKEYDEIRSKRHSYQELVADIVRRGIDQGTFRAVDPRLASFAIFGMCNWAYQWFQPAGPMRSREVAYVFWDLLRRGLEPDGRTSSS